MIIPVITYKLINIPKIINVFVLIKYVKYLINTCINIEVL